MKIKSNKDLEFVHALNDCADNRSAKILAQETRGKIRRIGQEYLTVELIGLVKSKYRNILEDYIGMGYTDSMDSEVIIDYSSGTISIQWPDWFQQILDTPGL